MKIGILTQPLRANYGGLLQNYALQQVLISEGYNVETIDWKARPIRVFMSILKWNILAYLLPSRYSIPKYKLNASERSIIQCNTNKFIDKYIKHTSCVESYKGFRKFSKEKHYDAYVVGSDQCWRPGYNAFLKAMFLNFTKNEDVKRISYAASFGTDQWEYTKKQTKECSKLIKKFNYVFVREDSGVKLCEEHFGVDAKLVLDPTMLLTKDDYIKLLYNENESVSKGNLFTYILDPEKRKIKFIQHVEKETGLISFTVLPKYQAENRTKYDVKNRIEECVFPNVTTWLRAFMDAEMVIVDSFHGMVFSIIFNKPFWVIGNDKRGQSRFTSLLKLLELENRLISGLDIETLNCEETIDWGKVNRILDVNKSISKQKLMEALKS